MRDQESAQVKPRHDLTSTTLPTHIFDKNRVSEKFIVYLLGLFRQTELFVRFDPCSLMGWPTFFIRRVPVFQERVCDVPECGHDFNESFPVLRYASQILKKVPRGLA